MTADESGWFQRLFGHESEDEDDELELDLEQLEGSALRRRLSLSWLAMVPLLAVYALGAQASAAAGASTRNTSELFLGQLLRIFGEHADAIGLVILAALTVGAFARASSLNWPFGEGVLWTILEGAGIGLVLGPLLLFAIGLFPDYLPTEQLVAQAEAPDLARVALIVGGAAWEELLFRLVLYSALLALARGLLVHLGAGRKSARMPSEVFACLLSSLAFSAFHLESVIGWMGGGGEDFEMSVFVWRAVAGLLLALIARSRGIGVAVWAHAVFNVGLALGTGPGVFLIRAGGS